MKSLGKKDLVSHVKGVYRRYHGCLKGEGMKLVLSIVSPALSLRNVNDEGKKVLV